MLPPVASTIADVRKAIEPARSAAKRIGFVPTMGALHAGHAALIRASRAESDYTVVSIFVNPTQFGPHEDFARYPRNLEADRELCAAVGTDLIFAPSREEMYSPEARTTVEVAGLENVLCGRSRPGHFRGVATVVLKLLNIVQPHRAYFGQKDAQQVAILRRMIDDLNLPVIPRIVPTVREPDGLAMSSRNRYLDPNQRMNATCLVRALRKVESLVAAGERSTPVLERAMADLIGATPGALLDYAEIRDSNNLEAIATLDRPAVAALAVYFGTTRLIDNTALSPVIRDGRDDGTPAVRSGSPDDACRRGTPPVCKAFVETLNPTTVAETLSEDTFSVDQVWEVLRHAEPRMRLWSSSISRSTVKWNGGGRRPPADGSAHRVDVARRPRRPLAGCRRSLGGPVASGG